MDQDFLIQDVKRAKTSRETRKMLEHKERKPLWREYLETTIIALLAAVLLRVFVVSAYKVSSSSMEGSLFEGDYIFVNKMTYEYGTKPKQNDIIVFKYPNNPSKDFIKRIIAVPGQTIQVADKVVYVDGNVAPIPLHSQHIDQRIIPGDLSFRDNFSKFTVPEGEYFVMGDNRDDSRDSRFWGTVPFENIRGKAVFVYWSWQPDPDSPGWEFPYIIESIQWVGYAILNFPSQVRWDRIGSAL
ncbi:MAG: signal peptidase I [candidate division Zixibacteria bacterium]|nr:signal peptidase I [candidate division Zixibacteria bacterium]